MTIDGPLLYADGPFGDWYVSRAVQGDRRASVIAAARVKLAAHRQVAAVFTADELRAVPAPIAPPEDWSLAERARAAFQPDRSGDLVVLPKADVTPIARSSGAVATHGSPWMHDRRVPILFWWPQADGFEQPLGIETVDIMPTLSALLRVDVPAAEIDGRCRDLDRSAADSCAIAVAK